MVAEKVRFVHETTCLQALKWDRGEKETKAVLANSCGGGGQYVNIILGDVCFYLSRPCTGEKLVRRKGWKGKLIACSGVKL